ncbi:hypothetical protein IEQ34_005829 [Dendrobium chrysotoxum]|uniref:Uncharacterized protein n=1 Tax=Dendrobium chrysotoxum TaxID=161865 RepID=A0AAV7HAW1_DENCH|nr:hypothetical protein IEQ34_005829 [Dendrobium chrysotoxum]
MLRWLMRMLGVSLVIFRLAMLVALARKLWLIPPYLYLWPLSLRMLLPLVSTDAALIDSTLFLGKDVPGVDLGPTNVVMGNDDDLLNGMDANIHDSDNLDMVKVNLDGIEVNVAEALDNLEANPSVCPNATVIHSTGEAESSDFLDQLDPGDRCVVTKDLNNPALFCWLSEGDDPLNTEVPLVDVPISVISKDELLTNLACKSNDSVIVQGDWLLDDDVSPGGEGFKEDAVASRDNCDLSVTQNAAAEDFRSSSKHRAHKSKKK